MPPPGKAVEFARWRKQHDPNNLMPYWMAARNFEEYEKARQQEEERAKLREQEQAAKKDESGEFCFVPKQNITAYELYQCLSFATCMGIAIITGKQLWEMDPNVHRHFERYDPKKHFIRESG